MKKACLFLTFFVCLNQGFLCASKGAQGGTSMNGVTLVFPHVRGIVMLPILVPYSTLQEFVPNLRLGSGGNVQPPCPVGANDSCSSDLSEQGSLDGGSSNMGSSEFGENRQISPVKLLSLDSCERTALTDEHRGLGQRFTYNPYLSVLRDEHKGLGQQDKVYIDGRPVPLNMAAAVVASREAYKNRSREQ